ncbi:MAG: hypothetical protein ACYDDI_03505 [Candidatus Acidiferrales bacterium]
MYIHKKHWAQDNRREEYKELLSTLTRSFTDILEFRLPMVARGPEQQRAYAEAEKQALVVITDRIFIASEMEELSIRKRWIEATTRFDDTGDDIAFTQAWRNIRRDITNAAQRAVR